MFKFEFYIYKEITYEHIENKETGSKNTGESFRNHYKNINKFIFCTCLFDLGFCGTYSYEKRLYLFLCCVRIQKIISRRYTYEVCL